MNDLNSYTVSHDGKYICFIDRDGLYFTSNPLNCIAGTELEMCLLVEFLQSLYDGFFTVVKLDE